jgi:hypothetical protein
MIDLLPSDWQVICRRVTDLALPIFRIPFNTRLRSEIISSLLEIETAKYYKETGHNIKNATTDQEPDLFFLDSNTPLEIKVTKSKKNIKWMGNKISKRESQFVLIVWDDVVPDLYNAEKGLKFYATTMHLTPSDWSSDEYSYHASFLSFKDIESKHRIDLVGSKTVMSEYR